MKYSIKLEKTPTIWQPAISPGFIDLDKYDDIEKQLYTKTEEGTNYLIRETKKSKWFNQIPLCLSLESGYVRFNQQFSYHISRKGDVLNNVWFRITLPEIRLNEHNNIYGENGRIRWTRNLMHNLVKRCSFIINYQEIQTVDSFALDCWNQLVQEDGKEKGYDMMIGNIDSLTKPNTILPSTILNLPLPFFRDNPFPVAIVPYCNMKIEFQLRDWTDLLIIDDVSGNNPSVLAGINDIEDFPEISNAELWGNYLLLNGHDRKELVSHRRNMLIEQFQNFSSSESKPFSLSIPNHYYLNFFNSVKVIFFAASNERSNYLENPIKNVSLLYDPVIRLDEMPSDYFTDIQYWFHSKTMPTTKGIHMYSYALDPSSLDPCGSTNFRNFNTNSSMIVNPIETESTQNYEFQCMAVSYNILRIKGGYIELLF